MNNSTGDDITPLMHSGTHSFMEDWKSRVAQCNVSKYRLGMTSDDIFASVFDSFMYRVFPAYGCTHIVYTVD